MASKPGKEVTVEVKNTNGRSRSKSRTRSRSRGRDKTVKITVNSKGRGKGGQSGRGKRQSNQRVRNIVKQQLKKSGVTGPAPAVKQRAVATLGTIGANTSGGTELEACIFCNPVLVKDSTGSNQFGPVQALGAQYSMWRLSYLRVKLTPMVGSSAVSGTVARISVNPTATPSSTSWSGLGARTHMDVTVGKGATFSLKPSQLNGPREGWWLTNTNDNAQDTLGIAIEVHTLGATMRTYQDGPYTGSLFLLELAAEWQFTGYSANPNLVNLEKSEDKNVGVTFSGTQGEPLVMEIPTASFMAQRIMSRSNLPTTMARADGNSTSDTVWQVLNTAVSAAELVTPPPFNWLVKGGWWFVKLIAGRTRNAATQRFLVYPSYADALANKPAICTGSVGAGFMRSSPTATTLQFTQMNQPSLGHGEAPVNFGRSIPIPGDIVNVVASPETTSGEKMTKWVQSNDAYYTEVRGAGNTKCNIMAWIPVNPQWYTEQFREMEQPQPLPIDLKTVSGNDKIGDVYALQQYHTRISDATQVTTVMLARTLDSYGANVGWRVFIRTVPDSPTTGNVGYMRVNGALVASESLRIERNKWYLLLNVYHYAGTLPANDWQWNWAQTIMSMGDKQFVNDPVMAMAISPPPPFAGLLFTMRTSVPDSRALAEEAALEQEADDLVYEFELSRRHAAWDEDEHWCDTCDAAEPPPSEEEDVSDEETDTEIESDEDETDEVDRFDLHDSSGSEPEDDDVENSRVTLLNTLVNQGMDIIRAAKISKRAFPTHSEKIRRSVYMDCLATGCSPASAWSEACRAARRAAKLKEPDNSESRGHAE